MSIVNGIGKSVVKNEVTVALKRKFVGFKLINDLIQKFDRFEIFTLPKAFLFSLAQKTKFLDGCATA